MCSRNSRRERPGLFNGEGGFIYMRAAELRNVDTSTRSGLSSGTGEMKHVKDKRRNEGITREPRKRKRGKPRLRDHGCSCPGPSDPSVDTHSLSCNTITATAPDTAKIFFDHVFCLHGLPTSIVSDRNAKFTSKFWQSLFRTMGTRLALSPAFHPQTDGQTERANRPLEDMLRAYVSYRQEDWDTLLPAAEFACNNAPSASTQMTPFHLCYGRDPVDPYSQISSFPDSIPAAADFHRQQQNAIKQATD